MHSIRIACLTSTYSASTACIRLRDSTRVVSFTRSGSVFSARSLRRSRSPVIWVLITINPRSNGVSVAERERFSHQRVEARKDVGASGKHAVIEITGELVTRRGRTTATHRESPGQPGHAIAPPPR